MPSADVSAAHRPDTIACHRRAVERVIAAMHANLADDMTLEDMADIAIMSSFHLNRVFRQLTGVPPCRYLTALRLQAAKRLLVTTNLSVTDISFEVGYNSLGTFTRRFSELVGLSPGRFRNLMNKGVRQAVQGLQRGAADLPLAEGIGGTVEAPEGWNGPIFIGFFASAVPQSQPLACSLAMGPGRFTLPRVEDGDYHLLATGLTWSLDVRDYLLYDRTLRGGYDDPIEVRDGRVEHPLEVTLRPPRTLDPPILTTLPVLLEKRMERQRREAQEKAAQGEMARHREARVGAGGRVVAVAEREEWMPEAASQ
ncbi:MAG: AraC family transcriptional regulator [Acidobacteriota bacterium]